MRPVLHSDVTALARAIYLVPDARRPALCSRLLAQAEAADRHRKATGRLHPEWGDGTLMTAARTAPQADEPSFDDLEYCTCFELVLSTLIAWRLNPARS